MTAGHVPGDDRDEAGRAIVAALPRRETLIRFVVRSAPGIDAADVVQDAYLRLVAAARRIVVKDPTAFLFMTVRNLLKDRARSHARAVRSGRDAVQEVGTEEHACTTPTAEHALIARERLAIVERALAELAPNRRAALVLHRIDGLSHADIAVRLGLSVSMVEKHIRAALDHCHRRLFQADHETGARR